MARLLLIDDDPEIRTMFVRILKSLGDVEEATGGAQAIRLLAAREFDCVVLDLHMPAVDGFAVLEALSGKPGPNRDTPIFVVSADVSDAARLRAMRRHAVFFLSKPVNLAMLVSLVRSTLEKRASRGAPPPQGRSKRE